MKSWARRLPSLALILLAGAYLAIARGFKPTAATLPLIAGGAVLLLALHDLRDRPARTRSHPIIAHRPPPRWQDEATAIAGLLGLVGGFFLIGILPACALAVPLALRFGARLSWPAAIAGGVGLVAVLWLMFAWLLGLDLPAGLLFDGVDG